MSLLPQALDLWSLGDDLDGVFRPFPLGAEGKPLPNCEDCRRSGGNSCPDEQAMLDCKCLNCHSFYRTARSTDHLREMWATDDCLIGLRTGIDMVVLDFDIHAGGVDGREVFARLRSEGVLTPTVTALTGGGGCHLYYRVTNAADLLRSGQPLGTVGMDLKAEYGYVIAPPSAKPGKKAYTWKHSPWDREVAPIHPDLEDMLRPVATARHGQGMNESRGFATMSLFEWNLGRLRNESSGGRNAMLFRASCVGGEVVAQGMVTADAVTQALTDVAHARGLTISETRGTIASGMNRGFNNVAEG